MRNLLIAIVCIFSLTQNAVAGNKRKPDDDLCSASKHDRRESPASSLDSDSEMDLSEDAEEQVAALAPAAAHPKPVDPMDDLIAELADADLDDKEFTDSGLGGLLICSEAEESRRSSERQSTGAAHCRSTSPQPVRFYSTTAPLLPRSHSSSM